MPNRVNDAFDDIAAAERVMQLDAQHVIADLPEEGSRHNHIAIAWRGGVVWLDMSDQSDHFCIDVRNFVPADQVNPDAPKVSDEYLAKQFSEESVVLAGTGVFTIVNGRRAFFEGAPLQDPDGTPVRGNGWNGGYVTTMMFGKEPSSNQTNRPAGSGRG